MRFRKFEIKTSARHKLILGLCLFFSFSYFPILAAMEQGQDETSPLKFSKPIYSKRSEPESLTAGSKVATPTERKKPRAKTKKKLPQGFSNDSLKNSEEQKTPSYLEGRGGVEFYGGLENIVSVHFAQPALDFASLTTNETLVPYLVLSEQLYPTLKISSGRGFLANLRPRLEAVNARSKKDTGVSSLENRFSAEPGEIFISLSPSARFSLTVGKQNFQWGTAEVTSPSNWIFKPRTLGESLIKIPQTVVETRDVARINVSSGQRFNLVAMVEYEPESLSVPRIYSGRRALLKPEISWNNGLDHLGIVIGGAERMGFPFLGEYLSIELTPAMTFYFDTAHFWGGDMVKPARLNFQDFLGSNRAIVVFDQPFLGEEKIHHEGVAGLRYSYSQGLELKVEGYLNSQGVTATELSDAQMLGESPSDSSALLPLFFQPQSEYRSQKALLLSARQSEFGYKNKLTVLLRYFKPLSDDSGAFLIYNEYSLSDNAILFAAGGGFHGKNISESAFPQRFSITLGHKYVW